MAYSSAACITRPAYLGDSLCFGKQRDSLRHVALTQALPPFPRVGYTDWYFTQVTESIHFIWLAGSKCQPKRGRRLPSCIGVKHGSLSGCPLW